MNYNYNFPFQAEDKEREEGVRPTKNRKEATLAELQWGGKATIHNGVARASPRAFSE